MPRPVSICVLCGTPIEGKVVVDIYIRNRRAYSQRKLASLCPRHWAVIEAVLKAEGLVGAAKAEGRLQCSRSSIPPERGLAGSKVLEVGSNPGRLSASRSGRGVPERG